MESSRRLGRANVIFVYKLYRSDRGKTDKCGVTMKGDFYKEVRWWVGGVGLVVHVRIFKTQMDCLVWRWGLEMLKGQLSTMDACPLIILFITFHRNLIFFLLIGPPPINADQTFIPELACLSFFTSLPPSLLSMLPHSSSHHAIMITPPSYEASPHISPAQNFDSVWKGSLNFRPTTGENKEGSSQKTNPILMAR